MLLIAGLAFGLFGDDSSGAPSVRLLGTPPATRTPAPPATRDPSQFTPIAPSPTPSEPTGATGAATTPGAETPEAGETPAGGETPAATETPSLIQTATPTPTLEIAPTEAPPTPTPDVNTALAYVDEANQYTPALVAQLDYLIGNVNAPNITSSEWRDFTLQSAQAIQGVAASLSGVVAPGCVAGPHSSLVAAAGQASAAAGEVIAAVNSNNASAATAAAGSLSAARDGINSAVANISNTVASSC